MRSTLLDSRPMDEVAIKRLQSFEAEALEMHPDGTPVCVLDRGGTIKGNKLDVYMGHPQLTDEQNHQAARNFGRRKNLTVEYWKGE